MAIYEETTPVAVTVYCDECEIIETNDYMVPAGVDSLDTARHYMATHKGWIISRMDDICPPCFERMKDYDPILRESILNTQRVWTT